METVFVVICSSGEYSDRHEWVAGVYTDKEEAIRIAAERLSISRALEVEYDIWSGKLSTILRRLQPAWPDPLWNTVTAEMRSVIDAEIGERPTSRGEMDNYYITEAPLNQWGRWDNAPWYMGKERHEFLWYSDSD